MSKSDAFGIFGLKIEAVVSSQLGNLFVGKMRKEDKAKYNYKRIEIYLSPKDAALFEKKAILYKNWGGIHT